MSMHGLQVIMGDVASRLEGQSVDADLARTSERDFSSQ